MTPPALIQFAQCATAAANHWTGADLGAPYTAIGEPAPAQQERRAPLLSGDGCDFTHRVFSALDGTAVDSDLRINQPEEAQPPWQLPRPTVKSLRY